jgi:hypothetical protein
MLLEDELVEIVVYSAGRKGPKLDASLKYVM